LRSFPRGREDKGCTEDCASPSGLPNERRLFPLAFLQEYFLSSHPACCLSFLPTFPSSRSFIRRLDCRNRQKEDPVSYHHELTCFHCRVFIHIYRSWRLIICSRNFLFTYQEWIRNIGGVLVIIFGLFVSGFIRLDFLSRERKFHLTGKPAGYIGTVFIGMTFAAAWTPLHRPILGTILLYASTKGSAAYGLRLLAVYSGTGSAFFSLRHLI